MKKSVAVFIFCIVTAFVFAADLDLVIDVSDIRLEPDTGASGGYHLFIRKKPNVNSVLLTETTKDPSYKMDNYAYRAAEYNSINGDEFRILDGKFLEETEGQYSLVDSTIQRDKQFGVAFHIYIPQTLVFGYPWTRNGTVEISSGTFINIRAFEKPYADYSGEFLDNPFMFNMAKKVTEPEVSVQPEEKPEPEIVLTDAYNPVAANAFSQLATAHSGRIIYSEGPDSIDQDLVDAIEDLGPQDKLDLVFAIDATGSMKDDIEFIRSKFVPRMAESLAACNDYRIGLLFYRDYTDTFRDRGLPVKIYGFTNEIEEFKKNLKSIRIIGSEGGDIPEAVYEALYASMEFYDWRDDAKKQIILVGDAEPHPSPRGTTIKCTKEMIDSMASDKGIGITSVITPDNKTDRRG